MTTTDTEPAILRAVLDDPSDNLPRLAYADLLEERGDDARAEFVRVQLELAGCPEPDGRCHCGRTDCRWCPFQWKQAYLLIGSPTSWGANGEFSDWLSELGVTWSGGQRDPRWAFRRGFVERVEMATDDFLAHAQALFSRHPITEVALTDRKPYPNGAGPVWFDASRTEKSLAIPASAELPTSLYPLLTRWEPDYGNGRWRAYPDNAAALADLSRACVAFGRAAAGLGELREVNHGE